MKQIYYCSLDLEANRAQYFPAWEPVIRNHIVFPHLFIFSFSFAYNKLWVVMAVVKDQYLIVMDIVMYQ